MRPFKHFDFLRFRKICTLFTFSLFLIPLSAHPGIEPLFLPDEVIADSESATLSADEVFKLSLLFSECPLDSEKAQQCLEKFEKIKAEVTSDDYMNLPDDQRGRAVLKFLFRDYLTTYNFSQTKTDTSLETGVYNCVSSALLYMAAAKACGLDVRGERTVQHAFCSIYVNDSKTGKPVKIDVETTNPYGFNPGSRETIENESKIKKYYVVPKKYYSNRQEVSDRTFAGLIAGNICSDCIKKGDYDRALPLGAARYEAVRLENSKSVNDVRQEFDILAANYVNLKLDSSEAFSKVVDWYISFIDRWSMTDFLQKNMDNAFNNLIMLCLKEENYPQVDIYFQTYQDYVTQKQLTKTGQIYQEVVWLNKLNDYMDKREYQTGLHKADEALAQLPQSSKIKNMRQYFYSNCIAIVHNEFARQANTGHYKKALQIISEGLELYPDDKALKKDLADLMRVMPQDEFD